MPFLYVANVSRQDQVVYYRTDFDTPGMPEIQRGRMPDAQEIKAGRQEALGKKDMHIDTCQAVIEQIRRYGALGHDEVKQHRARTKISLLYNTGKPVPVSAIQMAMDLNSGVLIDEGRLRRARAAVISNKLVEDAAAAAMVRNAFDPDQAPMKGFAVEVEQQDEIGPGGRLEEGYGGGSLDPRGPGAPPVAPPPASGKRHRSKRAA